MLSMFSCKDFAAIRNQWTTEMLSPACIVSRAVAQGILGLDSNSLALPSILGLDSNSLASPSILEY